MSKREILVLCGTVVAVIAVLAFGIVFDALPPSGAQANTSPKLELLSSGPSENLVYYVDRNTDFIYGAHYEGDIEGLALVFKDDGTVMTLADFQN